MSQDPQHRARRTDSERRTLAIKPPSAVIQSACSTSPVTNTTQEPPDAVEIPDEPGRVFPELVERNDCVCKNCYRRLKRKESYPHKQGYDHGDLAAWVEAELPPDAEFEIAEREYFETVEIADRSPRAYVPGPNATQAKRSACWNCGATEPHRKPTTRSRSDALTAAANVSVTLDEYHVAHDRFALVSTVDRRKRHPATSGDDFETFRSATAAAVLAED
jgi:hypothetical protein